MPRNAALLALLVGAIMLAGLDLGRAQSSAAPQAAQPYRSSLADLMTAAIQPRHIKLGLAGQEKNWPLAATSSAISRGPLLGRHRLGRPTGRPTWPT
jgi:hypothetical protein